MKKLIFLLILMVLSISNIKAQNFNLGTEVGQGIEWDGDFKAYQTTISFTPQMSFEKLFLDNDKFVIAGLTETYLIDSNTTWAGGTKLMYRFLKQKNYGLFITGKALWGEAGNQWLGGGLLSEFETKDDFKWSLGAEVAYNSKSKTYRGQLTVGTFLW